MLADEKIKLKSRHGTPERFFAGIEVGYMLVRGTGTERDLPMLMVLMPSTPPWLSERIVLTVARVRTDKERMRMVSLCFLSITY